MINANTKIFVPIVKWLAGVVVVATAVYVAFLTLPKEKLVFTQPVIEQGAVKRIYDGDTLIMEDGKRIRIWGIDAPELKQEYGEKSRDSLKWMIGIYNHEVQLEIFGKDRYNRYLAKVIVGINDRDVGLWMVEQGHAWVYKTNKNEEYRKAQDAAQFRSLGLWESDNPIPPWEFRKRDTNK